MTTRTDPLNEILLPASDLANRIKSGEKKGRPGEKLLAAAVLVLLAERDSTLWLIGETRELHRREREYSALLREEADPAAVDRVNAYLRLRDRTGVVA